MVIPVTDRCESVEEMLKRRRENDALEQVTVIGVNPQQINNTFFYSDV